MSLLIDAHAHLDHQLLIGKIDEIINRAKNAGLKHIVTNGINPETNRISLELSKKYDIVECAMGLYPRNILKRDIEKGCCPLKHADFDVDREIEFMRKNKNSIAAIGEVGLDFTDGEDKGQIDDFSKIISLAEELKKPVIVHSRKAERKCVEMLESSSLRKVAMHCFCGKKSLVKKIADNGWLLTAPTTIVRSQQFQEIAENTPISQLFCETDSPYLSPFKEQTNEPAYVIESYKKIAEIKNMDLIEVINNIYMNWQRVFE